MSRELLSSTNTDMETISDTGMAEEHPSVKGLLNPDLRSG